MAKNKKKNVISKESPQKKKGTNSQHPSFENATVIINKNINITLNIESKPKSDKKSNKGLLLMLCILVVLITPTLINSLGLEQNLIDLTDSWTGYTKLFETTITLLKVFTNQ